MGVELPAFLPPAVSPIAVPVALLLIGIVSVQFGATFATGLFSQVGAAGTTSLRLVLASIMLAAALRPWRVWPSARSWPWLAAYGVALGCMNLMFYLSLRTVPLGIAVALEFIGPLVVTLAASRRWLDVAWIALAARGIAALLPLRGSLRDVDPLGAGLALAAGGCWGIYIVCGRRVGRMLGTAATAWGTMIGMVLVLPIGLAQAGAALFRPHVLLAGLVVAFFSSALPYTLDMVAMTRLPARLFGTLTSLDPAVGAIMGLLFLHQTLTLTQTLAIAAVVVAACGATAATDAPAASVPAP